MPNQKDNVAPRTEAWIETAATVTEGPKVEVAPRTGAWIETLMATLKEITMECRPPHGGVD